MGRSSRINHVQNFFGGIGQKFADGKLHSQQYHAAYNKDLIEEDGITKLVNRKGDIEIDYQPDFNYWFHSAFQVTATYGPDKEQRPSILLFLEQILPEAKLDEKKGKIAIFDCTTDEVHIIFDDELAGSDNPRKSLLALGSEIDGISVGESGDFFAYWVDYKNPPRYIKLHVEDPMATDNTAGVLPIPNEADLLYVQRLNPVNLLGIAGVKQTGGGLEVASYSFAFRYYNSSTNKYSAVSLFMNPVPVILSNTDITKENDIVGGTPGAKTQKSIELNITSNHRHRLYYDSIQLFVVKRKGGPETTLEAFSLPPSEDFYTVSRYTYTGNEQHTSIDISEAVQTDSDIDTAKTIEEEDGRLYLANIKYISRKVDPATGVTASVTRHALPVSIDPMESEISSGRGFYDEVHNHLYRGFFRGEVYRFAPIYGDIFGRYSYADPFDFSDQKYDPNNIPGTWDKNWATEGTDWKFVPRDVSQGSIFNTLGASINSMGLRITGIDNIPSWAYNAAIVRRKRVKNILGQTPVINGVAVQGQAANIGAEAQDWSTEADCVYNGFHYVNPTGFDYDGSQDYYMPKILAMGHAKNLTHAYLNLTVDWHYRFKHLYSVWERTATKTYSADAMTRTHGGGQTDTVRRRSNSLLFLYPLEFLANADGLTASEIKMDGSESLEVIDCVLLSCFNAYRSSKYVNVLDPTYTGYSYGTQQMYAFLYSPRNAKAYYYFNSGRDGQLLANASSPSASILAINVAPKSARIVGGKEILSGGGPETLSRDISIGESMEHIRLIENGTGLLQEQRKDDLGLYDAAEMAQGGDISIQRSLAVILEPDEGDNPNQMNLIQDPTWFVWRKYINDGLASYSVLFPDNPEIDAVAVQEDGLTTTVALHPDDITRQQGIIDPGSGVPVYIANIVKGLGDDRYGKNSANEEYQLTNARIIITQDRIDNGTPLDFSVFGGDCFITRSTICVRTNAPKKSYAAITDSAKHWPKLSVPVPGLTNLIDYVQRVNSYNSFVEIIDLWVESEINGHYILRGTGGYPEGIESRDDGGETAPGDPGYEADYVYPASSGISKYDTAYLYLYNFGFSVENDLKIFIGEDPYFRELPTVDNRIHHSVQHIYNSRIGWDRFLPNDFVDVSSRSGPITGLIKGPDNKIWIAHENGLGQMFLGRSLAEDPEGNTLNFQSGKVIGYVRYLEENTDSQGDIGLRNVSNFAITDSGVFAVDLDRKQLVIMGGRNTDIDFSEINTFVRESMIPDTVGLYAKQVVTCWSNLSGEVYFYNNKTHKGVIFDTKRGVWKTYLDLEGVDIVKVLSQDGKEYAIVNKPTPKILQINANEDRSQFMGVPNKSSVEMILNTGYYRDMQKKLSNIIAVSSGNPGTVDITVQNEGDNGIQRQEIGVEFNNKQHNNYIANEFMRNKGRISGKNIRIKVVLAATPNKVSMSTLTASYRIDQRQNAS